MKTEEIRPVHLLNEMILKRIRDAEGFELNNGKANVSSSLGYFGNVWIRLNYLPKIGAPYEGHTHKHDHLSVLVAGKVRVEVEGFEPTEFEAPTFITIKADHEHKFVALTDNVLWYCVFAMKDIDEEKLELFGEANNPYIKPLNPIE